MNTVSKLSFLIFLLGCNNEAETEKNDTPKKVASQFPALFLDSISRQDDLSVDQIKKYTSLDSAYYTGMYSNATFRGDTTWSLKNGAKAAIVNYSDNLVCSYKIIFIFLPEILISIDSEKISTDCDRDDEGGYTTLEYTLLNDSSLKTKETHVSESWDNKTPVTTITNINWSINNKGFIEPVDTVEVKK